ncbi:hypothetical protein EYB26_009053 [Talaromyces marneffei]|uniref:uncharacterized protein n=1 Tax=Talaromyces marneffei TaxID=37727 RepID=UPI0012A91522|nr:uncharacterized protein EYB26_009053 [Talaromyces marneffei]QGA21343.1 hypothetical protein EYB26_009053 [Talaromyces marneffei]
MSNPESQSPSEQRLKPLNQEEVSRTRSSEASTIFSSSNEDKENRPPPTTPPQPQFTQYIPEDDSDEQGYLIPIPSVEYDDEDRVEYGKDPIRLRMALDFLEQRMQDIDDERRSWYGEDAEEAMEYQFRFTPDEIQDRAAARHGGQTFYQHMVEIGQALDFNRIVGDETESQLNENLAEREAEWRDGTHPDAVPESDHGGGDDHGDRHNHNNEHGQGDNHDKGDDGDEDGDKCNGRGSTESSESGHRGDDEDESSTSSTDSTRSIPRPGSGSRNPKRRIRSSGTSDSGRASKEPETSHQRNSVDEAAARQLRFDLHQQQQPEQTEEEYIQQQEDRYRQWKRLSDIPESPQPDKEQQEESEEERQQRGEMMLEAQRRQSNAQELEEMQQNRQHLRDALQEWRTIQDTQRGLTEEQQETRRQQMGQLSALRRRMWELGQRQHIHMLESQILDREWDEQRLDEQLDQVQGQRESLRNQLQQLQQLMRERGLRLDEQVQEHEQLEELRRLGQQERHIEQRLRELRHQLEKIRDTLRTQRQGYENYLQQEQERNDSEANKREKEKWYEWNRQRVEGQREIEEWLLREHDKRQRADEMEGRESAQESESEDSPQQQEREQQGQQQQRRYPAQSLNKPPQVPVWYTNLKEKQRQEEEEKGRRQNPQDYPAESQNQRPPPSRWLLYPQPAPPQSWKQEQGQSQWPDSDSSSSSSPIRRKRGTYVEDVEEEEEEEDQEEGYGVSSSKRARKEGPEPDQVPGIAAAQAATLALQRVIEETPQRAEGRPAQTPGQGSRQLLPAAEIREQQTSDGMQVSAIFTNPRTRAVIRPEGFAGRPPRISGGAWLITNQEAVDARDRIQEDRRTSELQAELEQSTTRPVIDDDYEPPSSPSPPRRPTRPVRRLSPSSSPPPLALTSNAAQQPAPIEPPVNHQPPIYLPGPSTTRSTTYPQAPALDEPSVLPQVQPATKLGEAPAEEPTASQSLSTPDPAADPAPTRSPTRRGQTQTTATSPILKGSRIRRQTSAGRESKAQEAARRRPRRGQWQTQHQSQIQDQTQPLDQNQIVNQNPGQAPAQNTPRSQHMNRTRRRTRPYDAMTLRRSTRNRKPPDRYVPAGW